MRQPADHPLNILVAICWVQSRFQCWCTLPSSSTRLWQRLVGRMSDTAKGQCTQHIFERDGGYRLHISHPMVVMKVATCLSRVLGEGCVDKSLLALSVCVGCIPGPCISGLSLRRHMWKRGRARKPIDASCRRRARLGETQRARAKPDASGRACASE